MSLQLDVVMKSTRRIAKEIKEYQKNLTINYIVHHDGQLEETVNMVTQDISKHPAHHIGLEILRNNQDSEESRYLGTAAAQEKIFMGLGTKYSLLSLNTINLEQFKTVKEANRFAYHQAWHALDAYEYYQNPKNRSGNGKDNIVRLRNALELTMANLQADIFSAVVCYFHKDRNAFQGLSVLRSQNVLRAYSGQNPEFYPFPLAMESIQALLKKLSRQNISRRNVIATAMKTSKSIQKIFDNESLQKWIGFSQPAQDMAWRGYNKAEIVSAAINTSQDTHIRSAAYLVSQLLKIKPASLMDIHYNYSPYADNNYNEKLHKKSLQKTYEDVIAQGLHENSSAPFIQLANKQNQDLTEGLVLGWCAPTLQAAAKAYDYAIQNGKEPEKLVREEFEKKDNEANWQDLKEIGEKVVNEKREGNLLTLQTLKVITEEMANIELLHASIQRTLDDPDYHKRLENVKEYSATPSMDGPKGPAITNDLTMQPKTPSHAAAPLPERKLSGNKAATQETKDTHQKTANQIEKDVSDEK